MKLTQAQKKATLYALSNAIIRYGDDADEDKESKKQMILLERSYKKLVKIL